MKALLVSGSRNPDGQTAQAAQAVLEGFTASGGETESVFLPSIEIECCRQCDEKGWGICRTEGQCVIEDDLEDILAKIKAADAVIFATPVYYGDLAESMRAFTDRVRRCVTHSDDTSGIEGKIAIGVCVAGGGGGGAPSCCATLDRVLRISGFDVVDMIPVRKQNLDVKRAQLKLVGEWLATGPSSH